MKQVHIDKINTVDTSGVAFWGDADDEELTHEHLGDAIGSLLDDLYPDPLPETIVVTGFRRREIDQRFVEGVVQLTAQNMLASFDDEYGGPDSLDDGGVPEQIVDQIRDAITLFADNYFVWQCEPVIEVYVDVMPWVKENAPEWLDE